MNEMGGAESDDVDDDDGGTLSEDKEERKGNTDIVQALHKIPDRQDAWMLRQIAKGNDMRYTLDKLKVPYEIIGRERVYSPYNDLYARYVKWMKFHRGDRDS
ncbi:hypothetical protein PHYBOEH_008878 [Phytophthora boehmeriae]|uniref:RxLR effector protein n=1 Tax=Phytophthora boehmeriae TaxID=109152 RepID=A0A8T1VY53_9STRA|nr:hypothetical protein PHYBOEH_008878 [Phytophthora boehmeriae]